MRLWRKSCAGGGMCAAFSPRCGARAVAGAAAAGDGGGTFCREFKALAGDPGRRSCLAGQCSRGIPGLQCQCRRDLCRAAARGLFSAETGWTGCGACATCCFYGTKSGRRAWAGQADLARNAAAVDGDGDSRHVAGGAGGEFGAGDGVDSGSSDDGEFVQGSGRMGVFGLSVHRLARDAGRYATVAPCGLAGECSDRVGGSPGYRTGGGMRG